MEQQKCQNLSDPTLLAIWLIGMNLNNFPAPNSIESSFKGTSGWKLAIMNITIKLPLWLHLCQLLCYGSVFFWSMFYINKDLFINFLALKTKSKDQPRSTPTSLLRLPLCLVFHLQLYLTNKGTIQPYFRYIFGTSSSLLEEGNYQFNYRPQFHVCLSFFFYLKICGRNVFMT